MKKECYRYGCRSKDNLRFSDKYGYICGECFEELVAKKEYPAQVEAFMESDKHPLAGTEITDYLKYYEEIFSDAE
ncbi:MAG: hypothetical protein ACRC62_03860 [Microcoleus sp.]